MWTLNWILNETIWKRCCFRTNINEPLIRVFELKSLPQAHGKMNNDKIVVIISFIFDTFVAELDDWIAWSWNTLVEYLCFIWQVFSRSDHLHTHQRTHTGKRINRKRSPHASIFNIFSKGCNLIAEIYIISKIIQK